MGLMLGLGAVGLGGIWCIGLAVIACKGEVRGCPVWERRD